MSGPILPRPHFTLVFLVSTGLNIYNIIMRVLTIIFILSAFQANALCATDPNQARAKILAAKARQRTFILDKIQYFKKELVDARNERIPRPGESRPSGSSFRYFNEQQKRESLKRYESIIRDYVNILRRIDANDLNEIMPAFSLPLKVGQLGRVGSFRSSIVVIDGKPAQRVFDQQVSIETVIDPNNSIVTYYLDDEPQGRYRDHYKPIKTTVWLQGISTVGLVDNNAIEYTGFLEITGTISYYSSDNAKRTIFLIEPFKVPPDPI